MAFSDQRFPVGIAFGSTGGPERRTEIATLASGHEERNAVWANSKRRYDVSTGIKSADDMAKVVGLFEEVNGRRDAFRLKDRLDHKSCLPSAVPSALDQSLGTGDGVVTAFQLRKRYGMIAPWYRPITKPVAGTVKVALGGVVQTSGWSVSILTGVVTFVSPPSNGASVTAGFEFDVPVRFEADSLAVAYAGFAAGQMQSIILVEVLA